MGSGSGEALPLLTASRLKCYRRCPREHHYAYELGYRPVIESDAIRFGTLLHTALEAWWKATDDRHTAALTAIDKAMVSGTCDPYEAEKAKALMTGYHVRWIDEPLEVLAVEERFTTTLINPATGAASKTWELGGKVDAIVVDQRDGQVYVTEHKSSGEDISAGSEYWKRLRLDSQVTTYLTGAESLGNWAIAGCLYDVIGKPALRPLKATPLESRKYTKAGAMYAGQRDADETPEEYGARCATEIAAKPDRYYVRGTVLRLEVERDDHAFNVWQLARQIREAQLAGRAPQNPDSCARYGRTCDFFPVCCREATLDDPIRYRRVAEVNEELTEVPNATTDATTAGV